MNSLQTKSTMMPHERRQGMTDIAYKGPDPPPAKARGIHETDANPKLPSGRELIYSAGKLDRLATDSWLYPCDDATIWKILALHGFVNRNDVFLATTIRRSFLPPTCIVASKSLATCVAVV